MIIHFLTICIYMFMMVYFSLSDNLVFQVFSGEGKPFLYLFVDITISNQFLTLIFFSFFSVFNV